MAHLSNCINKNPVKTKSIHGVEPLIVSSYSRWRWRWWRQWIIITTASKRGLGFHTLRGTRIKPHKQCNHT